ncbi:MAG: hypothetical protein DME20_00040 [Verrucomicrobia bacterium]|nr:MAG: hypothetical protein DME92_04980 [Verrucomicrobiota bacterium]PYJ90857.1 MAG: hypothetical protein DME71_04490 [Verrucomicrobiota bacterium]PYK52035.1 MAG: hypothetical protein DME20_00040 [Verrucomicrobiota bacterium]
MKKATKRTAKGEQKKQSILGQPQQHEKRVAGQAEMAAGGSSFAGSQSPHRKTAPPPWNSLDGRRRSGG